VIHVVAATLEIMLVNLVYRFDWELLAGFWLTMHRKEKLFLFPKIPC
jgi:hypothetical protein